MMGDMGKPDNLSIATICATVNSGFEQLANQECLEKLGPGSCSRTVKKFRGRIIFELPVQDVEKAVQLRSVDNLSVVVDHIKDVDLQQEKEQAIGDLCQKILESDWKLALDTWKQFTKSEFCLDPLPGTLPSSDPPGEVKDATIAGEDNTKVKKDDGPGVGPSPGDDANRLSSDPPGKVKDATCAGAEENNTKDKKDDCPEEVPASGDNVKRPTFRVTCTRSGEKHKFNSRDVAPAVGSLVNETFGWPVKMKEYDIEVVVNVLEDSTLVSISLTKESLHRRNVTHFGITTLKSTIAYCMLRLAQPKPGEVIIDPMCGVGGIPLEGLLDWKSCYVIAGDVHDVAVERTKANLDALSDKRKGEHIKRPDLENDVLQWDVTNLPLKSSSVDVFVTDLPFGKRMGNRKNNWSLYHKCLEEMGRVCRAGTGRAVLLTQDKKCMVQTLQRCHHLWRKKNTIFINHGGLKACVYLLQRAKVKDTRLKRKAEAVDEDQKGEVDQEDNDEEENDMESTDPVTT